MFHTSEGPAMSSTSTPVPLWQELTSPYASSETVDDPGLTWATTQDPSLNLTSVKGASAHLLTYDIFVPILGAVIIVTNLSVVISSGLILKKRPTPRTTYLFLGNVAMADLVTGVAVLFGQLYPWELRAAVTCYMQIGMIVSSTVTSIWSVGLISIDRFLYILYGLHYQRWLTPLRARWLISFTWLLGLLVGFLPALGWRGNTNNGKVCWFIRLAPPGLIVMTAAVGFLPVLAATVLYSIILYHALQKVKQLQHADKNSGCAVASTGAGPAMRLNRGTNAATNTDHDQKKSSPKKWKAIKVVLFTNGSFVLTWVPYFIACLLYVACEATSQNVNFCKSLRVAIGAPLAILGFLNSLLNPVIYAWWHNGFRAFVRKTLCKPCGKRQAQTSVAKSKTTSCTTTGSATSSTKTTGASSTKSSQSKETMPILEEQTEF